MQRVRIEERASVEVEVEADAMYWKRRFHRESTIAQKVTSDSVGPQFSAEEEVVSVFVSALMGFTVER